MPIDKEPHADEKNLFALAPVLCLIAMLLDGREENQNHGLDPKKPTATTIWHYCNGVQDENFDNRFWGSTRRLDANRASS